MSLADDPGRRRQLGDAARHCALARLDAAAVLRAFLEDAEQLAGSAPRRHLHDGADLAPRD